MLPLLSLIYADLFNRCLFFFPTSASQHPLQVWKDKKSHVASLPLSISPHTVARPHGLVCPGVTCCRSVEGGSSNRARWPLLENKGLLLFFRAHPPFSSSCWIVWPLKRKSPRRRSERPRQVRPSQTLSGSVEGEHLLWRDTELMFYVEDVEF